MDQELKTPRETAIAYAVEGLPDQQEIKVDAGETAQQILRRIKARHPDSEIVELVIEDEDEAVGEDARIVESIEADFKVVHAARGRRIAVAVRYEAEEAKQDFQPSATIRRITRWAVEKGFDLVEKPSKFVLKLGDRVLEPELHLGQITGGAREIELVLVHGRKIQG